MTDYPDQINASIKLRTGDELRAVAFRRGFDEKGLVHYVIALPNGDPISISTGHLRGYDLDMLPARSSVGIQLLLDLND